LADDLYCERPTRVAVAAGRAAERFALSESAAAIMVTASVPSADAEKGKRDRQETTTVAPSLDRRITGRTRTCGHDTMLYDSNGMPYGPYCH
jgi:hypothetical protein